MKISSMHPIVISDDTEKLMEFYASLGFEKKHSSITDMGGPVYIIGCDDAELEIMETPKNAHFPMPAGFYGIRLNVDDLDAAVEAIKQAGGTVLTEPLETPYTTVVAVQDVDGNYLTIMKHKRK